MATVNQLEIFRNNEIRNKFRLQCTREVYESELSVFRRMKMGPPPRNKWEIKCFFIIFGAVVAAPSRLIEWKSNANDRKPDVHPNIRINRTPIGPQANRFRPFIRVDLLHLAFFFYSLSQYIDATGPVEPVFHSFANCGQWCEPYLKLSRYLESHLLCFECPVVNDSTSKVSRRWSNDITKLGRRRTQSDCQLDRPPISPGRQISFGII